MQKLMRMMHKQEEGFTLVELMVVVVIIGILVAIAIPIYTGIQESAAESAHDSNVRTLQGAAQVFFTEHPGDAAEENGREWTGPEFDDDHGTDNVLADYLDGDVGIPDFFDDIDGDSEYTVTIEDDGTTTITPGIGAYGSP